MQHLQDLSRGCPWEGVMLTFIYLFEAVLLKNAQKVDQTTPFFYNLLLTKLSYYELNVGNLVHVNNS